MSDDKPDFPSLYRLVEKIDGRTERIEEALFIGYNDEPPVLSRLATLEERTKNVERAGPRAGLWGGLGTGIGAAVIVVLGYLGIKPPGQGQ